VTDVMREIRRQALHALAVGWRVPRFRAGRAAWSAHDLRRTAITAMARLGIAPIVLGHVANHRTTTKAGVTLAVYSQHTYASEKRAALDIWAAFVEGLVSGAPADNVVALRG
jgi:hypothetical protein